MLNWGPNGVPVLEFLSWDPLIWGLHPGEGSLSHQGVPERLIHLGGLFPGGAPELSQRLEGVRGGQSPSAMSQDPPHPGDPQNPPHSPPDLPGDLHIPPASPGLPQTPLDPSQTSQDSHQSPPGSPHLIGLGVRGPPGAAPAGVQQVQGVEPHQPLGQPAEGSAVTAGLGAARGGSGGAGGHLSAVSKATVTSWAQTEAAAVWGRAEATATASVGPRTGSSTSSGPGACRGREGAQGIPQRPPRAPSAPAGHPPAPAGTARSGPPPRSAWGGRNDPPPPAWGAAEPGKPGQKKNRGVPMSGDPQSATRGIPKLSQCPGAPQLPSQGTLMSRNSQISPQETLQSLPQETPTSGKPQTLRPPPHPPKPFVPLQCPRGHPTRPWVHPLT